MVERERHDEESVDNAGDAASEPRIRVDDRRHWARGNDGPAAGEDAAEAPSTRPSMVEEYRRRTEEAEARLQDYIAAYKKSLAEQDDFRERLTRDVERRVQLKFGEVVADLLDAVDDLDLALSHAGNAPEVEPLARGVQLVRERILAALLRQGLERLEVEGEPFDPQVAEAVRLDPVSEALEDGTETSTLRPGYRLGDYVVRPARVTVGRKE